MGIKDIIKGKKEWQAHMARVKSLPQDYQVVYYELQKYLFKIGPAELADGISLLSGIVDLFVEGAALGKSVLEVTGSDVASFCDDLVKDSKTCTDIYEESIDKEISKAMKRFMDKQNKKRTM